MTTTRGCTTFALLVALVGIVACSPTDAPTPGGGTATPQPDAPLEPAPIGDAEAEEFGTRLAQQFADGDVDAVTAVMDVEAMIENLCDGIEVAREHETSVREWARTTISARVPGYVERWCASESRFKGLVDRDGRRFARFRFLQGSGFVSIVDLRLRRDGTRIAVDEFVDRMLDDGLVATLRASFAVSAPIANRDTAAVLVEQTVATVGDSAVLVAFFELIRAGEFESALRTHARLPQAVRDTLIVTILHVRALSESGDIETSDAAVRRAVELFPVPHFRYALLGIHLRDGEFDRAVAVVDEFIAVLGRDAGLLVVRASLQALDGDVEGGRATLLDALADEPTSESMHSVGIAVLLAARDFKRVAASMEFLESQCGHEFAGTLDDPSWAEFLAAPESAPWR